MWVTPRTADFYKDLAKAAKDIAFMEQLKETGELRGVKTLKRTLTPRAIKQFIPPKEASKDIFEKSFQRKKVISNPDEIPGF